MFNELSLKEVSSKQCARNILESLVKSSARAMEIGLQEMRLFEQTLTNLYQLNLFHNYNIDNWLNDAEVNLDLRTRFREIFTTFPLITENEIKENDFYQRSEFKKKLDNLDHLAWGLGAAYIYNTLAISLQTHSEWNNETVSALHYFLEENGSENYESIEIRNFSTPTILDKHLNWYQELQKESLNRSQELWERRGEFFPNLVFCKEVETQIKNIGISKMLSQIIDRLNALNQYASNWLQGNFNYENVNSNTNLRISPESDATLRQFGLLRKFTIPEQGKKIFSLHIKTGDLRFHFYPDNETRTIYIGYIGKHLRTVSFN